MFGWKDQSIDLLNRGSFRFVEPGPLHAPIHGFEVHRDEKLALILETEAAPNAKSAAVQYPPGTVRFNTEQVELVNVSGIKAVLSGVQTRTVITRDGSQPRALKEVATIHQLTVTPGFVEKAAYTIEWLDNLPTSPFIWPDCIRTISETTTVCSIALSDDSITLRDSDRRDSSDYTAVRLTVAGNTLYVCAPRRADRNSEIRVRMHRLCRNA